MIMIMDCIYIKVVFTLQIFVSYFVSIQSRTARIRTNWSMELHEEPSSEQLHIMLRG